MCELRGKGVKNIYGVKNGESLYLFTPFSYLCREFVKILTLAVSHQSRFVSRSLIISLHHKKNKTPDKKNILWI